MTLGRFFARSETLLALYPLQFSWRGLPSRFSATEHPLTQACITAAEMHGELVDPLPLHVQNQINRGKEDLPVFLRVLLVAFVRYENHMMALSRCCGFLFSITLIFVCATLYTLVFSTTSPARAIQKQTFKIITTSFRDFYSVPFVYFHLVYMRFANCILHAPKTKPSLFRSQHPI